MKLIVNYFEVDRARQATQPRLLAAKSTVTNHSFSFDGTHATEVDWEEMASFYFGIDVFEHVTSYDGCRQIQKSNLKFHIHFT